MEFKIGDKTFIRKNETREIVLNFTGVTGQQSVNIPSNFRYKYRFISIDNNSPCTVYLRSNTGRIKMLEGYQARTWPVPVEILEGFEIEWINGAVGVIYRISIYFSVDNLCLGVGGGVGTTDVNLVSNAIPDAQAVPTKLTGRKATVSQAAYSQVLNVAAGAGATYVITPPAGELWRVKTLYLDLTATTGGSAGTHYLAVRPYANALGTEVLRLTSNYNALFLLWRNVIASATTSAPATGSEQMRAIQEIVMTADMPLTIIYQNDTTGGIQSGTLLIRVTREVEYVVS